MAEVCCYNGNKDKNKIYKYVAYNSSSLKNRYTNHKHSFKHKKLKYTTSISNLIHELKDKGREFDIKWRLIKTANSYKLGNKICNLCICEALII